MSTGELVGYDAGEFDLPEPAEDEFCQCDVPERVEDEPWVPAECALCGRPM